MDYIYAKASAQKPKKMLEFGKLAASVRSSQAHPGARLSTIKNTPTQTTLSSKKSSFHTPDTYVSSPFMQPQFQKSRAAPRATLNARLDQTKTDLNSLKAQVLNRIFQQEQECIAQVKNYLATVNYEIEKVAYGVTSNINSFCQILSANLANSFIELEAELDDLERSMTRASYEGSDMGDQSEQRMQQFQARLTSFAFDASVFPTLEFEGKLVDRVGALIRIHYPEQKPKTQREENNLFLESVHDPFLDDQIKRRSMGLEKRRFKTEYSDYKGSSINNRVSVLRSKKSSSSIDRTEAAKQTANVRTSMPKMRSVSSLNKDMQVQPNPSTPISNFETGDVQSPAAISRIEMNSGPVTPNRSPKARYPSPSYLRPPSLPEDFANLKIVDYSKRKIDEVEILKLLENLEITNEGFFLDLSKNLVSDAGLKLILRKLVDYPVVFMNLDENLLGDDSVAFILSFVNYNKALRGLSIKGNARIRTQDLKFVARKRLLEERNLKILY